MQTHIKSCKLTETLKKWLTVDLKVDREPELKDRQRRRRENRDTRRLWWVCIILLPEKTRSNGGDAVKTDRIRGDAVRTETVFVLGLPPWWVSILNLAEKKTREDRGSKREKTEKTEDRPWWGSIGGGFRYFLSDGEDENGDRGSVVEAPSESFDRSTVRFSFARRRTREREERERREEIIKNKNKIQNHIL
ncbi:hypothetical protein HID58_067006 [Brassica napus]|uniref:Uncharacterized protein n=1 Tax=Brassica napus TaxID=3708 RepID=A0ABQ7ZHB9_BRANA|nr:hypothetical protein HID58_067006 [Brassica napus]